MKMIYYLRFWSTNSQKVIIKLKELEYKNWQRKNKQIFELEHPQSCLFKITLRVWLNNISIHYYKVFDLFFLKKFTAL